MAETVICVGALVHRADRVLLVRQAPGHSLAGVWTIPWGRLENGESPSSAAVRETLEEASVECNVEGLVAVQELPAPWLGWIAHIYRCAHVKGDPRAGDREVDDARYVNLDELRDLREPIEDYCAWLIERYFQRSLQLLREDGANPYRAPGFI